MNTAVRISLAASVRSLGPGALTSRLNTKARATTATTRVPQATRRTISMGPPLPSRELGHVAGEKDAAVTLAVWLVRKGTDVGSAHLQASHITRSLASLFPHLVCARDVSQYRKICRARSVFTSAAVQYSYPTLG